MEKTPLIALVGAPNSGKTALFNRLTGSRQKVANYAGVTVERKEGVFKLENGKSVRLLDCPGAYALEALSLDEKVTQDILSGSIEGLSRPDLLICVVDSTNLGLHLKWVLEVKSLGLPILVALNLMDESKARGLKIDTEALKQHLGVEVIETVAISRAGIQSLSLRLVMDWPQPPVAASVSLTDDLNRQSRQITAMVVQRSKESLTLEQKLDGILLHPQLGPIILFALLFAMFQAVYSWATPLMDAIEIALTMMGGWAASSLPDGLFRSFVAEALFGGLGSVLVFLPQILILFLFILVLEESGYLPRAAFMLDGIMARAGLTGRSFIPLLSSFACAIPGIMATRSIPDLKDRLSTILVAPLMTCSARLPVYVLLIGVFVPNQALWGPIGLQGFVLFCLYVAGIVSAFIVAFVLKLWRGVSDKPLLLMLLPHYRMPNPADIFQGLKERAWIFISRITGIIFAANTLLWLLATFPRPPVGATRPDIDYSFAGQIGHALEPLFAPIGFNWQIVVALIPGLAAREVAVSALGTVYAISGSEDEINQSLGAVIGSQWSIATALSLLAWYVFAPQCLSTLAVIRRETQSWKWVGISAGYLFALAYLAAFITYWAAKSLLMGA
jgi:ferrous iron transport protein B